MRSNLKKQISSMGVILPYDYNIAIPPKIVPILFFSSKLGSELKNAIDTRGYSIDPCPTTDVFSDLVFIRRNYDGSELYYFVNCLTYDELLELRKYVKEQKGGILL